MNRRQRLLSLLLSLALFGANLLALNYLLAGFSGARLDLTEEGVYSITPATREIVRGIDEELTIFGYFSGRTHPKLAPLVPEIADMLDEYRAVSRGKIHVEIVDPGEDEEAEREAADRFGVRSMPFQLTSKYEQGIVNAYFSLVVKYGDRYERYNFIDLIEIEPLGDSDIEVRLRNLEYDLTRAIKKVVYGFRGTDELFERLEQPVRLTAIVSSDALPEIFADVPAALDGAAQALAERGGEKFVYERLDPFSDPQADRRARELGLPPLSAGLFSESSFYLYGLLQIGDRIEQLPLYEEGVTTATVREAVENALRRHTPGYLKTVGVVAPKPPQLPPQLAMQMPQPPPEFNELERYLGQEYQVTDVDLSAPDGVPSSVDVLLVVKPREIDSEQLFHLDQYLMRGGRVVLCAGRYEPDFQAGLSVTSIDTGLEDWLAHHGVAIDPTLVLDDRNQALPIPEVRNTAIGQVRTISMAPYPYLVQVREDGFVNRDITSTLDTVGIYWGSPIELTEPDPELEVLPILRSSPSSWTDDDLTRVGFVDYEVPAEGTEPQLLAVALAGEFESFFAGEQEDENDRGVVLERSPATRLVVVGNSEFLSDFVAQVISQMDAGFFMENLRFVQNVIDWTTLDSDLATIRSRGLVSRRLERVESEGWLEAINTLFPALALALAGAWIFHRRRNRGET